MFVNVCALAARSKKDLKIMISHYSAASVNFVLTLSISKNKVMCKPESNKQWNYVETNIKITINTQ